MRIVGMVFPSLGVRKQGSLSDDRAVEGWGERASDGWMVRWCLLSLMFPHLSVPSFIQPLSQAFH